MNKVSKLFDQQTRWMRRALPLATAIFLLAPSQISAQERFISLDDVKLRYEIAGNGPAVVLLHGWGVDLESWHFLFPNLSDEYTVIRYDRRGFGQSEGPADQSLDPIDLRKLLDELKIDRAVVLGHSQGGGSALRFAFAFPERISGLILFGAGPPPGFGLPWNGPDAFPSGLGLIAKEYGLDSMRAIVYAHPLANGFIEGSEGLNIVRRMFGAYNAQDLLEPKPSANATPAPHISKLSEIKVPTLVITGEMEMPYFQIAADALAYGIPNAERVTVPRGGHSVMLQQPESFNREIKEFLNRVYR